MARIVHVRVLEERELDFHTINVTSEPTTQELPGLAQAQRFCFRMIFGERGRVRLHGVSPMAPRSPSRRRPSDFDDLEAFYVDTDTMGA